MAAARGRSGWVGWPGVVEDYPLAAGGHPDAPDGPCLDLSVSAGASSGGALAPLHAGSVWNSGVRLAELVESGFLREELRGRVVLELGAGAALPSLTLLATAGLCAEDAESATGGLPLGLVISDFPSDELLGNIEDNLRRNAGLIPPAFQPGCGERLRVVGHAWGEPVAELLAAARGVSAGRARGFDAVLLADCIWDRPSHEGLLQTLCATLQPEGTVWMAHCHHWPGHEAADEHFFGRAEALGLVREEVSEVSRKELEALFGNERQCVFIHRLRWAHGPSASAPPA